MTEIDLLKRVRDDVQDPDPAVLAAARERLLSPTPVRRRLAPVRRLASRPVDPAPVRRPVARSRLVLAGGLALTLAGGLLVADVIGRDSGQVPGAVADAGTFLANASAQLSANPDAPIPPGQFRQITVQRSSIAPFGTTPELRATTYSRSDKWIPSVDNSQYVTRYIRNYKVDFETPAARVAAHTQAPDLFEVAKPKIFRTTCGDMTISAAPGAERRIAPFLCKPSWMVATPQFLARQPRDPDALLASLRNDTGMGMGGLAPDQRAFANLASALSTGIVPADLRAALYQAARKIPGIQLLQDVVTLDGRRGRAIGLANNGYRHDIIISAANGQYIGDRIVVTQDGPGKTNANGHPDKALKPGDTYYSNSVTTQITPTRPPTK
ncbi:CU044_5270 family protein [Kribbella sp. NPDC051952]|uniref:CU044_5270 family protein n=1 Tax=Kribbella sp. NPDC051952 TaxID=3154851 RepID=UPI003426D9E8